MKKLSFTLVEVIAVLVIIGIIGSLTIPALFTQQRTAIDTHAMAGSVSSAKSVMERITSHYEHHRKDLGAFKDILENNPNTFSNNLLRNNESATIEVKYVDMDLEGSTLMEKDSADPTDYIRVTITITNSLSGSANSLTTIFTEF